jgi:predicted small lipoprotein YifL
MLKAWLIVLAAACIAGCGNKGPLYLPDSKPPPKHAAKPAAPPPSAESDDKK